MSMKYERSPLTMDEYLKAVRDHGTDSREYLLAEGFHPRVIYAKAEKAARKGYIDYGVIADRGWLTRKGIEFIA